MTENQIKKIRRVVVSVSGIICAVFLLIILCSRRGVESKYIAPAHSPDIRKTLQQAVETNDYIKIGYLAGKNVNINQLLDNGKSALITAAVSASLV